MDVLLRWRTDDGAATLLQIEVNAYFVLEFPDRMKEWVGLTYKADTGHRNECLNSIVCQ
jgi:hypothetical protein